MHTIVCTELTHENTNHKDMETTQCTINESDIDPKHIQLLKILEIIKIKI